MAGDSRTSRTVGGAPTRRTIGRDRRGDRQETAGTTSTTFYPDRVEIRLARHEDAEAIRQIYNPEAVGSTVTFDLRERTLAEQEAWLAERSGVFPVVVAVDDDGTVLGFASLSAYRSRPAYRTTVEDSVYISVDARGRGVGRTLLEGLMDLARQHGFHAVMARIVDGHEASIALHGAVGFEIVGTEREVGRKFNRWLDVVLMQKIL